MKLELDKITIGYSELTDSVFVGVAGKPGVWLHKKNITNEFITCAIAKWGGFREKLTSSDGKVYEISIKQLNP